ncbi:MAG: hypothetical protein WAW80_00520 [Candidatus Saccharimonadales bacterium]
MLLVSSLLSWWYGVGWKQQVQIIANRLDGTIDYFSFSLLLKTLFSPYRQISAGGVDGPLEVKLRAMADKLFSRIFGAFIRIIIIIIGGIAIGVQVIFSLLMLVLWGLVPLLPIAGIVMVFIGWTF